MWWRWWSGVLPEIVACLSPAGRLPTPSFSIPLGLCSSSQVVALERQQGGGGRVAGVVYADADGAQHRIAADAVVLATGGFGASAALLKQHAPQVRVRVRVGGLGDGGRLVVGL